MRKQQQQQQLFYLAVCALSMFLMVRSFPRQAPSLASYTTTVQPFQHVPLKDTSESVANIEKELSSIAMLQRTLSFYSAAIPVFLSYKILGTSLKFRRDIMNEVVTNDEETKMFNDLHEWGSDVISNKIADLKGFYVKTGQIISTRVDIFPAQYTSKLAMTQDALDPLPIDVIRRIVSRELLDGGDLSDLFADFESTPLGSASVAQVHKATLLDGRVVAVKVQRPGIKSKLLGDIINLKNFAKAASKSLPLDYFKIFSEIERSLVYELDFLYEAQATAKVAAAVQHSPINEPQVNE
jgi:aarF domain-containing kinase